MNRKKRKKNKNIDRRALWAERLSRYICPIMLGSAICYSIIYIIYEPVALSHTIMAVFGQLILYLLFDKLKSKPVLGGAVYMLLFMASVMYSLTLLYRGTWTGVYPISWFYGDNDTSGYHPTYMRALFVGGGFFLTSILYYFTQVRYRSMGVMLCTLFPFVFYAKRGDPMPEIMITLIITLFLAVMIHNRRIDPAKDKRILGKLQYDRAYIISFAVFISVTGALAMTVKKPTYRSQLEKSADFFDNLLLAGNTGGGYESTSSRSSTRRGGFSYDSTPLFYVEDDGMHEIYYLRRQVYDTFDGDVWESKKRNFWYDTPYSAENPEYSVDDILFDANEVIDGEDIPEPSFFYDTTQIKLYDESFSPTYLPAPLGTVTDNESRYTLKHFKYYPSSTVMRVRGWAETPEKLDDTVEITEIRPQLYRKLRFDGLTGEEYIKRINQKISEGSEAALRLKADYMRAYNDYTDLSGVTDRIAELSQQITVNCKSDIEKADAIVNYFADNGYKYSTEYSPSDNSIDYFLFESKTGYCAGYATAMTLMARSLGLPARYVEGFAAFERTNSGDIIVRDGYAHAFVEVYIPAAGWLTFDPTVSDYRNITPSSGGFNSGFLFVILFWLSRFFIVIIVSFFVIFVLLFDRIKERLLRIFLVFLPVKKRVLKLYANLINLVSFSEKDDYSHYTVKMLGNYLYNTRGVVPDLLLELFEKTAFGGYEPTKEEYAAAYKQYKKCYRYIRKIPKEKTVNANKQKTANSNRAKA